MGAKPQVSIGMARRKVREVCNLAPGYGKTEEMLLEKVNEVTGGGVSLELLRQAIEWNHAESYIRREKNEDTDEVEWFITDHGQAKERIK